MHFFAASNDCYPSVPTIIIDVNQLLDHGANETYLNSSPSFYKMKYWVFMPNIISQDWYVV